MSSTRECTVCKPPCHNPAGQCRMHDRFYCMFQFCRCGHFARYSYTGILPAINTVSTAMSVAARCLDTEGKHKRPQHWSAFIKANVSKYLNWIQLLLGKFIKALFLRFCCTTLGQVGCCNNEEKKNFRGSHGHTTFRFCSCASRHRVFWCVLTNISYKPLASIFSVKVSPKSLWPHPR